MSGRADRAAGTSVKEFIDFVYPGVFELEGKCPPWPVDVFAIVASVMRRNGGYVHCVAQTAGTDPAPLLGDGWPEEAEEVGEQWREAILTTLEQRTGKDGLSIRQALDLVDVPLPVQKEWDCLLRLSETTTLDDSKSKQTLCIALIKLSGYADEASHNLGFPVVAPDSDAFVEAGSFLLEGTGKLSFCNRVHPSKARVLAKRHTPQQGLTLRSMTHHLSLCMPWEVNAQWHEIAADRHDDVLNLLILPWPSRVDAKDFRSISGTKMENLFTNDRLFEYVRAPLDKEKLRYEVSSAIKKALAQVAKVDALIFPELALTKEEWKVVEEVAEQHKLLLIAGIIDDVDLATQHPVNSCRIKLGNVSEPDFKREAYRQAKHHRWCLDRSQVLQYDLGGQLPSTKRCWENSHIEKREVFFATLGGWLTLSVLICEDLARQDPIADTLRSVGPSLVVALLMDGPQLASRWSARYASVLADDPGTSVLTVTSLGMCLRSRPAGSATLEPSRVIVLWKDKLYGFREIALPEGMGGCVLSLSFEGREDFTADGRSDSKGTQVPVFSGISFIEEGA